jgi:hypothetical protein
LFLPEFLSCGDDEKETPVISVDFLIKAVCPVLDRQAIDVKLFVSEKINYPIFM